MTQDRRISGSQPVSHRWAVWFWFAVGGFLWIVFSIFPCSRRNHFSVLVLFTFAGWIIPRAGQNAWTGCRSALIFILIDPLSAAVLDEDLSSEFVAVLAVFEFAGDLVSSLRSDRHTHPFRTVIVLRPEMWRRNLPVLLIAIPLVNWVTQQRLLQQRSAGLASVLCLLVTAPVMCFPCAIVYCLRPGSLPVAPFALFSYPWVSGHRSVSLVSFVINLSMRSINLCLSTCYFNHIWAEISRPGIS